ncbi:hypothetical protein HJG60_010446 [Phyllostomus discolor]|uniref:Uncharacterized protein n=1 Tax=Phyllostomus discolor TaxID=89673 RepID=A0A834EES2_9CHIR|nr:hypothetical protein HJG60_010446 [Phyllostomus discolor]
MGANHMKMGGESWKSSLFPSSQVPAQASCATWFQFRADLTLWGSCFITRKERCFTWAGVLDLPLGGCPPTRSYSHSGPRAVSAALGGRTPPASAPFAAAPVCISASPAADTCVLIPRFQSTSLIALRPAARRPAGRPSSTSASALHAPSRSLEGSQLLGPPLGRGAGHNESLFFREARGRQPPFSCHVIGDLVSLPPVTPGAPRHYVATTRVTFLSLLQSD